MPSKKFLFAHQGTTLKPHLELFMGKESKIRKKRNLHYLSKPIEYQQAPRTFHDSFFYKHFGRNEKYANYRDIFLVKTFDISNLLSKFAR